MCRCHVNPVCEGGDYKTRAVADILVAIQKLSINDHDVTVTTLFIVAPLEPKLRLPLKVIEINNLEVDQLQSNVARMSIKGDEAHDLHAIRLAQISAYQINQTKKSVNLFLVKVLHGVRSRGNLVKNGTHFDGEIQQADCENKLIGSSFEPFSDRRFDLESLQTKVDGLFGLIDLVYKNSASTIMM